MRITAARHVFHVECLGAAIVRCLPDVMPLEAK
jgi:hypothetical protein